MTARILVTGGAGYVGSVLVPRLLERDYQVAIFDKFIFGDSGLAAVKDRVELIRGDIMRPPAALMDGVFAVIHLAGLSSQGRASYHSPRYTDRINHLGTEIIARQAKVSGVRRFVYASSCSIYCTNKYQPTAMPPTYKEDDPVDIFAPYALSKRAAEEALLELADGDFRPIILRKGTIYGFSPKMRYDLVLNAFTKDAFCGKRITVHAGGEVSRPMIDIQDVAAAYLAALELPIERVGGRVFNVLHHNRQIIDLAKEFQEVLKVKYDINIDLDIWAFQIALDYKADSSRFRDAFVLEPVRTLDDAISEIWNALERGHDYDEPRYYNDRWHMEALRRGLVP